MRGGSRFRKADRMKLEYKDEETAVKTNFYSRFLENIISFLNTFYVWCGAYHIL